MTVEYEDGRKIVVDGFLTTDDGVKFSWSYPSSRKHGYHMVIAWKLKETKPEPYDYVKELVQPPPEVKPITKSPSAQPVQLPTQNDLTHGRRVRYYDNADHDTLEGKGVCHGVYTDTEVHDTGLAYFPVVLVEKQNGRLLLVYAGCVEFI